MKDGGCLAASGALHHDCNIPNLIWGSLVSHETPHSIFSALNRETFVFEFVFELETWQLFNIAFGLLRSSHTLFGVVCTPGGTTMTFNLLSGLCLFFGYFFRSLLPFLVKVWKKSLVSVSGSVIWSLIYLSILFPVSSNGPSFSMESSVFGSSGRHHWKDTTSHRFVRGKKGIQTIYCQLRCVTLT